MKLFVLLILFFSCQSFAECMNPIAESEMLKSYAGVPNAGTLTCKDLPNDVCLCLDGIDRRRTVIGLVDGKKGFVIDTVKKAIADAEDIQKVIDDAAEVLVSKKIRQMNCGRRVLAYVTLGNIVKDPPLTKIQKKQILNDFREIKEFLELGPLTEAKEEVSSIIPDGTLVTEGDQIKILAQIDKCLAP